MKTFVRALEDIAEIEQEKIFDQERAIEQNAVEQKAVQKPKSKPAAEPIKNESDKNSATLSSALAIDETKVQAIASSKPATSDYNEKSNVEIKPEVVRFGKGSGRSRRSPKPASKF